MTGPKRIQRQRTAGWRMPDGAVYVGRPTRWGNPFRAERVTGWPRWGGAPPWRVVDDSGREWWPDTDRRPIVGRAEADDHRRLAAVTHAVELFCLHTGPMGNYEYGTDTLVTLRRDLADRDLACWCPLDQPCHADVLLELANPPARSAS